jgi:hypothetical protein
MRKKAVRQGRSERSGESYCISYVESLSDARTPLADFINSLLAEAAGRDRAERFLTNAESSFNNLAYQPLIGAPLTLRRPDLATMHSGASPISRTT